MHEYRTKEWLVEHYVDAGMTLKQCAAESGVTTMAIHGWLRKNGIPTRGKGDHMKGGKNPFLGKHQSTETRRKIGDFHRGKPRSQESCRKQSKTIQGKGNHQYGKPHPVRRDWHVRAGDREFDMCSRWEVIFADLLSLRQVPWDYEPRTFTFADGSIYTPDFYADGVYYEVRGWSSAADIAKIALFRSEYPEIQLQMVGEEAFQSMGVRVRFANYVLKCVEILSEKRRECKTCGAVFVSRSQDTDYCCIACLPGAPSQPHVTRTCLACGKTFEVYPSAAHRDSCSTACGNIVGAVKRSGANHWKAKSAVSHLL